MVSYKYFIAVIALLIVKGSSLPLNDEIFKLPGWNQELPSRWFAGYIDAGTDV